MSLPEEGRIYQGKIVKTESFGAFVEITGFRINGLVHISQLSSHRVESISDVVAVDDKVFVKVLSVEAPENGRPKISLSMKYCDQVHYKIRHMIAFGL